MNKRYLSILGIYQSPQCIQGQPLARALRRTWTGRPTWVPIDVTCCVFGCLPRNLWHGDVDASMRLCVYGSMGLWQHRVRATPEGKRVGGVVDVGPVDQDHFAVIGPRGIGAIAREGVTARGRGIALFHNRRRLAP